MSTTAERMGVAGKSYGIKIAVVLVHVLVKFDLTRDEKLAVAWALVDQASSIRTTLQAQRAQEAIEDLYDAEDGDCAPATLRDGRSP